jgi:hypothetical protein
MPRATILATSGSEGKSHTTTPPTGTNKANVSTDENTQEKVHPDEDKLKNLFRITDPAGRVVYHVLYNDGSVLKVCQT